MLPEKYFDIGVVWLAYSEGPEAGPPFILLLQADPAQGGLLTAEESDRALELLPWGASAFVPGLGHGLQMQAAAPALEAMHFFLEIIRAQVPQ